MRRAPEFAAISWCLATQMTELWLEHVAVMAALLLEPICSSRKLKLLLPSPSACQGTTPALPNPFHPLSPGSLNSQQQTQRRTLPALTNFY